ncbi:VOC family protein [Saccharospirillum salsuginis]|uniref:Glyoxalase n=1 Tax=Saccharospirillum salsuginis TaxID=418750 RepID=A0A918KJ65_9GAMM|nr:VOC family protein [Saccharospirillum salsuginis]GGX63177.1 glyoxalase [Saccharospirillum salsuginis]
MASNSEHTLVWMDIPVADLDRALTFYRQVLNRTLDDYRPNNPMAVVRSPGGVSCALIEKPSETGQGYGPLPYFNCAGRLDQALSQAKLNGGRILQDIQSIEPYGYRAIVLDSEGNRIALHSPER